MEKITVKQFTKKHNQSPDETIPLGFKPAETGICFGLPSLVSKIILIYYKSYSFMDEFII